MWYHMKCQRVRPGRASFLVALVLLAACSTPAPPTNPSLIPTATTVSVATPSLVPVATPTLGAVASAPTSDEYTVYDTVINTNWGGRAQIVIEAATAYQPVIRPDIRGYVAGQLQGLQEQTIESFAAANQSTFPLANRFQISSSYVLLSKTDKDKIFNRELQASWQRFHTAYPGSQGLLTFSRVGFNSTMDQALVYFENGNGGMDAAGNMVLLEKEQGGWVVKRQLLLWEA